MNGDSEEDTNFMRYALSLAARAAQAGEVPVGALVVDKGEIIGEGWNRPIQACDPSAHAEIVAMRAAAMRLNNYRLSGATLYVTIEPCTMCVGAMIHARIGRLVYGADEPRAGAVNSALRLLESTAYNHRIAVSAGVLQRECADIIQLFFRKKRRTEADSKEA